MKCRGQPQTNPSQRRSSVESAILAGAKQFVDPKYGYSSLPKISCSLSTEDFLILAIRDSFIKARSMAVGDSFPALAVITLVEAYFLQRTVFAEESFRTVCLGALGVNLTLLGVYSLIIWPFFLNPLRHLPMVPVR